MMWSVESCVYNVIPLRIRWRGPRMHYLPWRDDESARADIYCYPLGTPCPMQTIILSGRICAAVSRKVRWYRCGTFQRLPECPGKCQADHWKPPERSSGCRSVLESAKQTDWKPPERSTQLWKVPHSFRLRSCSLRLVVGTCRSYSARVERSGQSACYLERSKSPVGRSETCL